MKKQSKLFLSIIFGLSLGLSSCSNEVQPRSHEYTPVIPGPDDPEPTPGTPVIENHTKHQYWHFDAVEATCTRSGSREYWKCVVCDEFVLNKPTTSEITDKGRVYHQFDASDARYVAPISHDLFWVNEKPATYDDYGLKAHYECSMCHDYFNEQHEHVTVDDLLIPRGRIEDITILDDICSEEKSTVSGWDVAREGFSQFVHASETSRITSYNKAGWQLTKEKYSDFSMRLRIDGVSNNDPRNSYLSKAFFIGADATNKSTRYEGVIGAMPTGFAITVFQDISEGGESWIEVFKWTEEDCDYQKGTFIGGAKGDFADKYFTIRVRGQSLTMYDENNDPLWLTTSDALTQQVSSLYLRGYDGGSIGVYNWTMENQTYPEPESTTFYIEDFSGKVMPNKDSGYTFVQTMLNDELSYSSTDSVIKGCTDAWAEGEDKFTIDASAGYNEASKKGSWRLTKEVYNNFRFTTKITNPTTTNPYAANANSCTSILFGAEPQDDMFKGYSLTVFYAQSGTGVSHWIEVHYHDGSAAGTFIGGINFDLKDTEFYFTIINKYLHIFRMSGAEIYGNSKWPGRSKGLYLEDYKPGNLGILKWDNEPTKYSIYDIKKLDNEVNDIYSEQDASKRVNVFLLTGQSNMEGNTKAIVNSNYYLKNYCDATEHNYDDYMNGYSNIQIAVHNNYMPNEKHYFTNPSDPMAPNFIPTKVGMGVTTTVPGYTYFGPEVGIAEKLTTTVNDDDNPIFLVKHASGGTGFVAPVSWASPTSRDGGAHIYHSSIQYFKNCMEGIKAQGYIPILKGVLWMQGCNDSGTEAKASAYKTNVSNYIYDIRAELSTYAIDNDGMKINFVDAGIFEGTPDQATNCKFPLIVNQAKKDVAAMADVNYYLDTNSTGLNCIVNKGGTNGYGGGDGWHYSADSMIRLGNGFGDVILDNNMLLF